MVRRLKESAFDGRTLKRDIQSMIDSGKNAYDIIDYLESLGFVEGYSKTFKRITGGGNEILACYDEVNAEDMKTGDLSVELTYLPREKGFEVLELRVLECKDDLRLVPVGESKKRTAKRQIKENFIDFDSDLKDEYRKYLDEISDRCSDISNLSDDIKTFLYTLSEIDDDAAYDCFKECIKGLASIEKKLAYIKSHYLR